MITCKQLFEKHGAVILTVLGSLGVIGTAAVAVSVTPKALNKIHEDSKKAHDDEYAFTKTEAIKSAWTCYIPAALVGSGTIACIIGSNVYSKHVQKSMASACALASTAYNEYTNKVKELYGEETHNTIMDAIIKDHCEDVRLSSCGLLSDCTLAFDTKEPEVIRTFYDTYSKRYFESTTSRVLQAFYHFNRNYTMRGDAAINELYEFLGLATIDGGDDVGFCVYNLEMMWVDINLKTTTLDDGMEVVRIEYPWFPEPLIDEYE